MPLEETRAQLKLVSDYTEKVFSIDSDEADHRHYVILLEEGEDHLRTMTACCPTAIAMLLDTAIRGNPIVIPDTEQKGN